MRAAVAAGGRKRELERKAVSGCSRCSGLLAYRGRPHRRQLPRSAAGPRVACALLLEPPPAAARRADGRHRPAGDQAFRPFFRRSVTSSTAASGDRARHGVPDGVSRPDVRPRPGRSSPRARRPRWPHTRRWWPPTSVRSRCPSPGRSTSRLGSFTCLPRASALAHPVRTDRPQAGRGRIRSLSGVVRLSRRRTRARSP